MILTASNAASCFDVHRLAGVVFPGFCELLDIWTNVSPVHKFPQTAVSGRKLLPDTTLWRPAIGDPALSKPQSR